MAAENRSPSRIALTSWKEIAAFFGREVRTVQRWEVLENLPVYRHLHHRKRSVYAYPKELEEWWRERGTRLALPTAAPNGLDRWVPIRWAALSVAGLLVLGALWLGLRRQPRHVDVAAPTSPAELGKRIRPHPPLASPLTGDFNGDGKEDVALCSPSTHEIYLFLSGSLPSSKGSELPGATKVVLFNQRHSWLCPTQVADYNGDGLEDLLLSEFLEEPESFRATGSGYIVYGRLEWPRTLMMPDAADATFVVPGQSGTQP